MEDDKNLNNKKSDVHTVREGLQQFENLKETFEKEFSLKEEEVTKVHSNSSFHTYFKLSSLGQLKITTVISGLLSAPEYKPHPLN